MTSGLSNSSAVHVVHVFVAVNSKITIQEEYIFISGSKLSKIYHSKQIMGLMGPDSYIFYAPCCIDMK